jgi:hypothetical protein
VAPLLRRIIRPTKTLMQTQKQNVPERCFFRISNYLDFRGFRVDLRAPQTDWQGSCLQLPCLGNNLLFPDKGLKDNYQLYVF